MNWKTVIVDAVIATVLMMLAAFWLNRTESFIVGFCTFLTLEVIRLRWQGQRLEKDVEYISVFTKGLFSTDSFSELRLTYTRKPHAKVTSNGVAVPRDYVLEFWRDCIAHTTNHWRVATYTRDAWAPFYRPGTENSGNIRIHFAVAQETAEKVRGILL